MRKDSLWRMLLGIDQAVVEGVEVDEIGGVIVASIRPVRRCRGRCGRCGRPSPAFDRGEGRRRWRALDLGTVPAFVEADAPRVSCRRHGVVVAAVPWARHGARHTRSFEAQVAWLATQCSKTAITQLMRIAWPTVGSILARVWADTDVALDPLAGLARIGIDEISYKRGQKYLTVVVDHDTGRLVWIAAGRDKATVAAFFDALGPERTAAITHVSADGAGWISSVVAERCPEAVMCADPFHVVAWATKALDEVRRQAWNAARGGRASTAALRAAGLDVHARGHARAVQHARFALWKNPENLTERQRAKLDFLAKAEPRLHRAYLLKERLRLIFKLPYDDAVSELNAWIAAARRSRIERFVTLQRSIAKHKTAILASIQHGLSNGRIESVNTKIRLITRRAFGFARPNALIALAMLTLGGHHLHLPGRN